MFCWTVIVCLTAVEWYAYYMIHKSLLRQLIHIMMSSWGLISRNLCGLMSWSYAFPQAKTKVIWKCIDIIFIQFNRSLTQYITPPFYLWFIGAKYSQQNKCLIPEFANELMKMEYLSLHGKFRDELIQYRQYIKISLCNTWHHKYPLRITLCGWLQQN